MKKRLPIAVALAACSFALPAAADEKNLIWLQVTPAGRFGPSDGREMKVPHWYIDAAVASRVIQRFSARINDRVVDYEHQTLLKEENGQPAPAAGWYRQLEWREGEGLFAQVELTARAAQYIADREYRYFSPVFMFHPTTGEVLDVQMGALTNNPAIDGMDELSLRAAATFGIHLHEEPSVNPLLKAVLAALGLAETTTEEQAVAALTAHQSSQVALRKAIGIDETATQDALLAACTGLKAKAAVTPDPAKFVSVDVLEQVKGEVAALTARLAARDEKETGALIDAALADGRLLKPMEPWARDLAKTNRAALTAYLDAAKPIAALTGSQTQGEQPQPDAKTGLTTDEMAVCTAMGLSPDQFKAAKEA
jgi:phage I-like protein